MDRLPHEIITKILCYLPFNDRKNFAFINTKWYHASIHPILIKNDWFRNRRFKYADIDEFKKYSNDFNQALIKSKRTFFNLKLYLHRDINVPTIFEGLGNRIMSLHLTNLSYFDDCFLDSITDGCNILKSLTLKRTKIMIDINKPRKLLLNLRILTLTDVYLSDYQFNIIMRCCPNLENLGLEECNISEFVPVIKRFYRDWENCQIFNSDDVFSYLSVINYLKNTKNINHLRLSNSKILTYLPAHIKLKKLTMHCIRPIYFSEERLINSEAFSEALSKQVLLNQLQLRYLPCCILSAVSKLQNLNSLNVHFTINSSEMCNVTRSCMKRFVESLSNMKELKELSITPWNREQPHGICSLPAIPDCTLSLLTSIDCFIANRLQILHFSNNLKYLHIHNGNILISSDLHLIFNNFINLKYLYLTNCINLNDSILEESPISNLKELITLQIDSNLTYKCLKYIKLLNLKYLTIKGISIKSERNSLSDFEESLVQFGGYVPALIHFKLCIKMEDYIWTRQFQLKLFNYRPIITAPVLKILKPYYTNLKKMAIYC